MNEAKYRIITDTVAGYQAQRLSYSDAGYPQYESIGPSFPNIQSAKQQIHQDKKAGFVVYEE